MYSVIIVDSELADLQEQRICNKFCFNFDKLAFETQKTCVMMP